MADSLGHGRCALIVEPDVFNAQMMHDSLEACGFTVTHVTSGVEAVIAARQYRPDIIFLAMQLRDVTGLKLIEWLHANPMLINVPIIALSSEGDLKGERYYGTATTLNRPLTRGKLIETLRKLFHGEYNERI